MELYAAGRREQGASTANSLGKGNGAGVGIGGGWSEGIGWFSG